MTLKRYNTLWTICAAIVFASAWAFDRLQNTALQSLVGGIAIVACLVVLVNYFKMYAQTKDEENDNE